MERYWTETGKQHTEGRHDEISSYVADVEWQGIPCTVGMMPGEGIKAVIKELKIPKVTHIAVSHELAPFGLYGIRAHYKNGMVEVFVVDTGTELSPICSDLYSDKEEADKRERY